MRRDQGTGIRPKKGAEEPARGSGDRGHIKTERKPGGKIPSGMNTENLFTISLWGEKEKELVCT